MNSKKIGPLVIVLALTSCSENTGVLSMGPDTYTISVTKAPILGGGNAAKRTAIIQANRYCSARGLRFMPEETNLSSMPINVIYGPTSYELTFECLKPGSPRLQPPNLEKAPDVVIQNQNN